MQLRQKILNVGLACVSCRWRNYLCGFGVQSLGLSFTRMNEEPVMTAPGPMLAQEYSVFGDCTESPLLQKAILLSVIKTLAAP